MTKQRHEWSADQSDILKVIEADLNTYLSRDKTAWEQNWVADDRFKSIMECGTLQIANGFAEFRANIFEAMASEPSVIDADIRREELQIFVKNDIAWATFDQIVADTENPLAPPNLSHNFRLLEKTDGQWRIIFHGVWSQPQRDAPGAAIEIAENCDVIWLNTSAKAEIATFPGLTISHGTLRATRPAWDMDLRATVTRAHALTGFARYNLAASQGGGAVTFPVVLGEDNGGALLMCWVKVTDGRVYVLLGDGPNLETQIDVAKVLYGLSKAQVRTIQSIARGAELSEISEELGISINTVKTHLKRVFEKAGVNSQVELLRRLVSFRV